jgi:hypothetical protein
MKTLGITKFKYALIRHDDIQEPYTVFAIPSEKHLAAWYGEARLTIVELSKDATDRERWRLEELGRILLELLPLEEVMES